MRKFSCLLLAAATILATGTAPAHADASPSAADDLATPVGAIPAPDPAELAAFRKASRALYDLKERAFAEGKADPIVTRFYAENAVSVGPDGKPAEGRDAFRKSYEEVVKQATVKVEPVHTYVRGDVAWDWANFRVTPKDPAAKPFTFAILFLWTKVEGRWVSAGDAYVVGEFPNKG